MQLSPACFLRNGFAKFLLRLASNCDPPISASQVAGTTGMWHHSWPLKCYLNHILSLGLVEGRGRYIPRVLSCSHEDVRMTEIKGD
jgi:hypothetical protein